MRHEHDTGRALVQRMQVCLEEQRGDALSAAAVQFVHLLREPIHKEDHCLFPMAERLLTDADKHRLLQEFQRTESDDIGPGIHQRCLDLATRLCARYQVQAPNPTAAAGCCHH